jgi:hypothetical protein
MRIAFSLCISALVLLCQPAFALERLFPPIAKRGQLSLESYPTVLLNQKERRLSAGAWIRNQNNTIDMPVSLRGQTYTVNYTENGQGEIDRVWILTPQEAQQAAPAERNQDKQQ